MNYTLFKQKVIEIQKCLFPMNDYTNNVNHENNTYKNTIKKHISELFLNSLQNMPENTVTPETIKYDYFSENIYELKKQKSKIEQQCVIEQHCGTITDIENTLKNKVTPETIKHKYFSLNINKLMRQKNDIIQQYKLDKTITCIENTRNLFKITNSEQTEIIMTEIKLAKENKQNIHNEQIQILQNEIDNEDKIATEKANKKYSEYLICLKQIHDLQNKIDDEDKIATEKANKKYAEYLIEFEKNTNEKIQKENIFKEKYMMLDAVLDDLQFQELYQLYCCNQKKCINSIIYSYYYHQWSFGMYLSKNYDFINSVTKSQKIKDIIIYGIEQSNKNLGWNKNTEKFDDDYDSDENEENEDVEDLNKNIIFKGPKKYLIKNNVNLNINELLELTTILIYPPFPLVNNDHNFESLNDNKKILLHFANCNSVKCVNANKKLFNLVMTKKVFGDVKIKFSNINNNHFEHYSLHSYILEEHKFFDNIVENKYINSIDANKHNVICVTNSKIIKPYIEYLYTGTFDYDNSEYTNKDINDLCELSKICKLDELTQMCNIIIRKF